MTADTKMGRPSLPESDRREKPLRIRLTDAERGEIDGAAELAGYDSTSAWARTLLLRAAQRERRKGG